MKLQNIERKFEHLFGVFTSKAFLNKESLGGEIPFFIQPFHPAQQVEVDKQVKLLHKRLADAGISVLMLDLYDISIELLQERKLLDKVLEKEPSTDKERFKKILQGPLDVGTNLLKRMSSHIDGEPHQIIFVTGVGQVFPFIRSHNVLNNLQSAIRDIPLVMFFPGVYNGVSLELFGRLKDDNYYRAFNLDSYQVKSNSVV